MSKIHVMIINDSQAMRLFLEDVIKSYVNCKVIGSYFDGTLALNDLEFKKPDVIILDLEMPYLDGLTFLEMSHDEKIPAIIVSNYVKDSSNLIQDAMNLGAVDSLAPPSSNSKGEFEKFKNLLYHKIIKAFLKSRISFNSP